MIGFLGSVIAGYTEEMQGISVVSDIDSKKTKFKTVLEVPEVFFNGIETSDNLTLKIDKNEKNQDKVDRLLNVLKNIESLVSTYGSLIYELEDDCYYQNYSINKFEILNINNNGFDLNNNQLYSFNINYLIFHEKIEKERK